MEKIKQIIVPKDDTYIIPTELQNKLHLTPGTKIEFEQIAEKTVLCKTKDHSFIVKSL